MPTVKQHKPKPLSRQKPAGVTKMTTPSAHWFQQLADRYHTQDFIAGDPIQFAHRFRRVSPEENLQSLQTQEMVAFLTAALTYGSRPQILKTLDNLLTRMDHTPWDFVMLATPRQQRQALKGFLYRFQTEKDILWLMQLLKAAYEEWGSLEQAFVAANTGWNDGVWPTATEEDPAAKNWQAFGNWIHALLALCPPQTYGQQYSVSNPLKGGPCKRLWLFLRWVVRNDAHYPVERHVDLGLWQHPESLKPKDLVIPLDTHVIRWGQAFGITRRVSPSRVMANEITSFFRKCEPEDPARYDFALFGMGVEGDSPEKIIL